MIAQDMFQGGDVDQSGEADVGGLPVQPDTNEDGQLSILVIGTSVSLQEGADPFSPHPIADHLRNILTQDASVDLSINVVAEDLYRSQVETTGYGQGRDTYDWPYFCHSLAQYYFWPEGRAERRALLRGEGEHDWDYVVLAGDPHIISTLPGFHSLGVNLVSQEVVDGGGQPLLLMPWTRQVDDEMNTRIAEYTRRTSDGARVDIPVIPAGLAWHAVPDDVRDDGVQHPSPNGAYLAAASVYTFILRRSASESDFELNDRIADAVVDLTLAENRSEWDFGPRSLITPFHAVGISDRVLTFNHTGTSSERGILRGLRWVLGQANVRLENGGPAPIHFNYGRANTEFEAHKRYRIAPDEFQASLGFPMQDNSNHGNRSMLFGLDKRRFDTENGTDLGVARKMSRDNELPHARAVPIRSLFAQMREAIPDMSAYSDGWHMSHDLDKATGAFMYTMLTGHCALPDEPEDRASGQWREWLAHKIGYETAWQLMHLSGRAPCLRVLPESPASTSIRPGEDTRLSISFANPPRHEVAVTVRANEDGVVRFARDQFVFTSENHFIPQELMVAGVVGEGGSNSVTLLVETESQDRAFDGLVDRWTYTIVGP